MRITNTIPALSALFVSLAVPAQAITLLGCYSSVPSGAQNQGSYMYQSSAYCSNQCEDSEYFALYNGMYCYCFDAAPQGSTGGSCNIQCAGYGEENCGGPSSYSIYSTDEDEPDENEPDENENGNATGSSSSSSSTAQAQETNPTQTSPQQTTSTTTGNRGGDTTTSNTASQETGATTSASTTSHFAVTSVVTQSANGVTSIVTVTSTPTASVNSASSSSGSPTNRGAIIGGAVGGAIGGLVIIVLIIFGILYFRRRGASDDDSVDTYVDDAIYDEAIKRQPIQNPFESPADFNMNVDQRLNPIELGNRRLSEGSLADHADYTRKILRVANPDDNV